MFFTVLPHGSHPPSNARNQAFLLTDNWDDWFKFSTMYILYYYDDSGEKHWIGEVKIGQFGLIPEQRRSLILPAFDALTEGFFSLGQDDTYYEKLNDLGETVRERILTGLRDIAIDSDLFERALNEEVMGLSLLRSVSRSTVRGQFRRIATGGARLTRYSFSYQCPEHKNAERPAAKFEFNVDPDSNPPTNIHVLIGRNGVGKTYHLQQMTRALVEKNVRSSEVGIFSNEDNPCEDVMENSEPIFENIVSVTFSAFDPFEPLPIRRNKSEGIRYQYIGLKRTTQEIDGKPRAPKTPNLLGGEFGASVRVVIGQMPKLRRWRRALSILEADPIFKEANITTLADENAENDEEIKNEAKEIFSRLSSGHKIVLLTVTRLVETVEEKTLVFLDEPEAHLHPPLLSAFVRALSDLLTDRNGVAIIATHSPVVLQEVPQRCVWKIRRSGREIAIERPDLETFGENVGVLTREVFGLEVTESGFHQLLSHAVQTHGNYEDILKSFGNQLGAEARAIIQGMLVASHDDKEES